MDNCAVVDMFCGVGGLSHGFVQAGFRVVAGIDNDKTCQYAFEHNNKAKFIGEKIEEVTPEEILDLYPPGVTRILIGCAPCQDYSQYNKKTGAKGEKWKILETFSELIINTQPDIVSMENVPELKTYKQGVIYSGFENALVAEGYHVSSKIVYCPNYGIPQNRRRLVLLASKLSSIELIPPQFQEGNYRTVRDTIQHLPRITAGEICTTDPLHRSSKLSPTNLERIKHSVPGGSWRDWPRELVAECHTTETGETYGSVYGRMEWDSPSPTMTTQCHGYGNGRFGHPEQHRAISLREAALLQTFPLSYRFTEEGEPIYFDTTGRHIGNAVPVELGRIIAESIAEHLKEYQHNDDRATLQDVN